MAARQPDDEPDRPEPAAAARNDGAEDRAHRPEPGWDERQRFSRLMAPMRGLGTEVHLASAALRALPDLASCARGVGPGDVAAVTVSNGSRGSSAAAAALAGDTAPSGWRRLTNPNRGSGRLWPDM